MRHVVILSCTGVLATAIAGLTAAPVWAIDIVAQSTTAEQPPVPEIKAVMVDAKTTALLILDLMKSNCGVRPRCASTIPNIRKLLDAARSNNVMVLYTLVGGPNPTPADIADRAIAPRPGEWVVQGGPDKFVKSDLDERLKHRGIKTIIVTGTSAQGAVLATASDAAQHGYKVIVPIDGISADDEYNERYAAWQLYKGGPVGVTSNVTLTRTDLIKLAK